MDSETAGVSSVTFTTANFGFLEAEDDSFTPSTTGATHNI